VNCELSIGNYLRWLIIPPVLIEPSCRITPRPVVGFVAVAVECRKQEFKGDYSRFHRLFKGFQCSLPSNFVWKPLPKVVEIGRSALARVLSFFFLASGIWHLSRRFWFTT
jgi:hypothetical protein